MLRDRYPETFKLLAIFLALPLTAAICERSFIALRRLKSYLRATMGQERLNSLLLAELHPDLLSSIDVKTIASEFIIVRNDRRLYYGVCK